MNDSDLVASIVARKQGSAARRINNGDVDGALNEYDDITIVPSIENIVDKALLIRFWNAVNNIDGLDVEQDARRKLFARQWADAIAGANPADIDRAQDGDADDIIEADGTVRTDNGGTTALRSSLSNPISSIDSLVSRLSSRMRGADANDETDEPDAVDNAPSDAPTIGNTGDTNGDNDEDSVPRIIDATVALVRDYAGKPVTATYDGWHLDDYGEVSGYVSINGNNVLLLISGEPDSGGVSLTVSTGSGGIPYFPLGSISDNGLLVRTPVLRGLTIWDHEPNGFTPGFNGYGSDFHMTASDDQNGNRPDDHPSHDDEIIVAPKHEDRTHIIDPAELAESIEAMTAGMSPDGGVDAMNDMVSKFIERYAGFNEQPLDGNGNDSDVDSQDVDSHDPVDDYLENAVTESNVDDYDESDSIEGNSASAMVNVNSTGSADDIIVDGDDNNGGALVDSDGSGSDGAMSDVTNDAVDDSASSLIVGADAMDTMVNDIHETLRQTGYSSDTTQESDDDANGTGDSSRQASLASDDAERGLFDHGGNHENNHGDKRQRVIVSPMLPLTDTDGNPDYSVYEVMAAGSGSRLFIIRDDDLGYVPRMETVTIGPSQYNSVILPEWVMAASDPADPTIIVIDGMSPDRESPLKRVIRTMVESGSIPVLVPADDDDESPIVSSEHNSEPGDDVGRLAISASLGKPVSIGNKLRVFFIAPASSITVLSAQLGLAGVES